MNNTALRAEAQSADNTHMVFTDREHEGFYLLMIMGAGTNR